MSEPKSELTDAVAPRQSGQTAKGREQYLAMLAADPDRADVLHRLGVLSHQEADSDAAVAYIGRALELAPDHLPARTNLGLIYLSLGRVAEAETEFRRVIEIDDTCDSAYANLGLVLRERGDFPGAEAALRHALTLNPCHVDAHNNLGNLCKETRRLADAERHYLQALALRPASATILENLGAVAIARGDWLGAADAYRAAVAADESAAGAWSIMGHALGQAGRLAEAETACRRALAIRPDWPDGLINLATVLQLQGDLDAAEDDVRRALTIDPAHARAHSSLGVIRQCRGELADAESCYRRAVEFDDKLPIARYNLGTTLLLQGNYADGFPLVESRFDAFPQSYATGVAVALVVDGVRRWKGGPLDGGHLLLWTEQGLGDSLMMLRFLPMLKRFAPGRISLVCERELVGVAQAIPGVDAVIAADEFATLPEFDRHCPLMSLPTCFGIDGRAVPFAGPYVKAPEALAARFATLFPRGRERRIGVVWAGSAALRDDARRSIPITDFAPLQSLPGTQWVSLQKGPAAEQIRQWHGPILDPMDDCRDFMDTAAVVENLDLVIAVDTAVAHLAGAMGKPVWLLNRAGSEWRWGTSGVRSPWYPTLRIFRQKRALDWRSVIDEVALELSSMRPATASTARA